MSEENKNSNLGCFLFFIVGVIATAIYFFATTSYDEFAEEGAIVLVGIVLAIGYFVLKALGVFSGNGSEKNETAKNEHAAEQTAKSTNETQPQNQKSGCGKAILIAITTIIIIALAGVLMNNTDFNAVLGILFAVVFFIVIAVVAWTKFFRDL